MAEGNDSEKTEPATPKRRETLREEGNVAISREVPNAVMLGISLMVFYFGASYFWRQLTEMFIMPFQLIGQIEITSRTLWSLAVALGIKFMLFMMPLMVILAIAGVAANVGQVGLVVANKAMVPKPQRLNPVSGFTNLFSTKSLFEAVKNTAKIIVISAVVWAYLKDELEPLVNLELQDYKEVFHFLLMLSVQIMFRVTIVLIILGIIDFAYQKYHWEEKNKMTKQEVKDEFKQMEGDPKVKARIRSIQREIAMRRMMAEVPKADVVITNPTRIAVALKYVSGEDQAPRVIAKGKGHVAAKIREEAAKHGIPILERKPLAQALYQSVKLNRIIPFDLYQAVAEILAYVYNLREKRSV